MPTSKQRIVYVTSSQPKIDESTILQNRGSLGDGTSVGTLFEFDFRQLSIKEILEVDIRVMVQEEVAKAYSQLKIPCIVEHAGLLFEDRRGKMYPGGLTKPMWNALGDQFVDETHSAGRRAAAMAVVAYCDGMSVKTFVGERSGTIAPAPRGSRDFYWDTIFMPDDPTGRVSGKTYSEIVADGTLGLEYKVLNLSQSTLAMLSFMDFLRSAPTPQLWR